MKLQISTVWIITCLSLGYIGYGVAKPSYDYSYLEAFIFSFAGVIITPLGLLFHGTLPNIWFVLQFLTYISPILYWLIFEKTENKLSVNKTDRKNLFGIFSVIIGFVAICHYGGLGNAILIYGVACFAYNLTRS